jgi:hypothetical protein
MHRILLQDESSRLQNILELSYTGNPDYVYRKFLKKDSYLWGDLRT